MARKYNIGNIPYGSSFDIGATRPIDSRLIVDKIDDLTDENSWPLDTAPPYTGMPVIVLEDMSLYILKDKDNYDKLENWEKAGGKGGISDEDLPTEGELGFEFDTFKDIILTLLEYIKNSISEVETDDDIDISFDESTTGVGKKITLSLKGLNGGTM